MTVKFYLRQLVRLTPAVLKLISLTRNEVLR